MLYGLGFCYVSDMRTRPDDVRQKDWQLGRRIQRLRKERNMSQWELGGKVHVSTVWISLIENGRKKPNLQLLDKIARALGVKASELLPY